MRTDYTMGRLPIMFSLISVKYIQRILNTAPYSEVEVGCYMRRLDPCSDGLNAVITIYRYRNIGDNGIYTVMLSGNLTAVGRCQVRKLTNIRGKVGEVSEKNVVEAGWD